MLSFVKIDPLCARLKEDTEQALKNLLPISTTSGTSADEKNQEKFLCAQLHRDLLFTMEYNNNARSELADFCSKIYNSNAKQLKDSELHRRHFSFQLQLQKKHISKLQLQLQLQLQKTPTFFRYVSDILMILVFGTAYHKMN